MENKHEGPQPSGDPFLSSLIEAAAKEQEEYVARLVKANQSLLDGHREALSDWAFDEASRIVVAVNAVCSNRANVVALLAMQLVYKQLSSSFFFQAVQGLSEVHGDSINTCEKLLKMHNAELAKLVAASVDLMADEDIARAITDPSTDGGRMLRVVSGGGLVEEEDEGEAEAEAEAEADSPEIDESASEAFSQAEDAAQSEEEVEGVRHPGPLHGAQVDPVVPDDPPSHGAVDPDGH